MARTIAVMATLDTKGPEADFVRQVIRSKGHNAIVIDPGILGEPPFPPDVTRHQVAAAGGSTIEEIISWRDKPRSMGVMSAGAAKILTTMCEAGECNGVIALAGAQGSSICSAAMRVLPFGVPKLLVSPVASGRQQFGMYVGSKDVTTMHSVSDILGLNPISRAVLNNAAGAIIGMVEITRPIETFGATVIAATMFGVTTPCLMRAKASLDHRGYETVVFHPNGTGGRAMEELIDLGLFHAVLDLSAHEVSGELVGGCMGAPDRLKAASRKGIPQVVGPGGCDFMVVERGKAETEPFYQGRKHYRHTPEHTLVRLKPEEMALVGATIAGRLNESGGPAAVIIPTKGFSFPDRQGFPLWDPEADAAFVDAVKQHAGPGMRIVEVDAHVNDEPYADAAVELLLELMAQAGIPPPALQGRSTIVQDGALRSFHSLHQHGFGG